MKVDILISPLKFKNIHQRLALYHTRSFMSSVFLNYFAAKSKITKKSLEIS